MATIIDTSFFFGQLNIAQKSDSSVSTSLQALINELEPALLADLLGYDLYKQYLAGIALGSPTAKWTELRDGKEYTNRQGVLSKWKGLKYTDGSTTRSLIANYVYWHWLQNEASETTGTGEKMPANQNAVNTSPANKMIRAWNEMVDMINELVEFLMSNQATYPEFLVHYSQGLFYKWNGFRSSSNSSLYKQNSLGI